MFEFGVSANALSRPDLRQLQHNALAEYMERKRGGKRDEEGLRSGARPHSAYLQPGNSFYTGGWVEGVILSLGKIEQNPRLPER